jgi:hypothetical protein
VLLDHKSDSGGALAARHASHDRQAPSWPEVGAGVAPEFMTKRNSELVDIRDGAPTTPGVSRLATSRSPVRRGASRDVCHLKADAHGLDTASVDSGVSARGPSLGKRVWKELKSRRRDRPLSVRSSSVALDMARDVGSAPPTQCASSTVRESGSVKVRIRITPRSVTVPYVQPRASRSARRRSNASVSAALSARWSIRPRSNIGKAYGWIRANSNTCKHAPAVDRDQFVAAATFGLGYGELHDFLAPKTSPKTTQAGRSSSGTSARSAFTRSP